VFDAAAEELWRRLCAGQLAPTDLALALIDRAEREKNLELGTEAVDRLTTLLMANPGMKDRDEVRRRVEALAAALRPEE
jgi:hypothetical protein